MPYLDPDSIVSREQFGVALTTARESAGLTVRELADRCDLPLSTVGGYFSGSHLPTLRMLGEFEGLLRACGIEDPHTLTEWRTACLRLRRTQTARRPDAAIPYLGLRSYERTDAALFFGRESLIEALLHLVVRPSPTKHILSVIGPSGSGKSSLVKAGLIPHLTSLDSGAWTVKAMTPGRSPMTALHACLNATGDGPISAAAPVCLVIDQFEEVFAPSVDETERRDFLNAIDVVGVRAVVLVLRADFYGRALRYHVLARAFQSDQLVVGPMTAPELRRAITAPARTVGVELPERLVEVLLADLTPRGGVTHTREGVVLDAGHEAGALPLLSHALRETWRRARRGVVTVEDYLATGGIRAAVASTAEQVYADLSPHEQLIASRVFLRMVSVTEDAADTRRRVSFCELDFGDDTSADDIVERFVAARLLTVDDECVEIAHEALISAWPRLRGWLEVDRAGMVVHRQLADAANAWRAAGQDPALLSRDGRLQVARELADDPSHKDAINVVERAFLDASILAAEAARVAKRRRTRRLQSAVAGLVVLTLVAAGLTTYAFRLRAEADRDRDLALSRQLAEASTRVRRTDLNAAAQLAVLAYRTSPNAETRGALLDVSALPLATRTPGPGGPVMVTTSPDGTLVAAVGDGGGLRVWRRSVRGTTETLTQIAYAPGVDINPLYSVAFSPDGKVLAVGGSGDKVFVWGINGDTVVARTPLIGPTAKVGALAFSPDGDTLFAASADKHVYVWSRPGDGPSTPHRVITMPADMEAVSISPDGRTLAAGGVDSLVYRWTINGSAAPKALRPLTGPSGTITTLAFSPDSTTLVGGASDRGTYIWSVAATTPAASPAATTPAATTPARVLRDAGSWVNALAYVSNGARLAVGGSDHHLRVYDTTSYAVLSDIPHPGPVVSIGTTRTGSALVTGATDGMVRVWPEAVVGAAAPNARVWGLGYGSDRKLYAGDQNTVRAFDVSPTTQRVTAASGVTSPTAESFSAPIAVSPRGTLVAAGGRDGSVWTLDPTRTGSPRVVSSAQAQGALVEQLTFSHDGARLAVASDDGTIALYAVSRTGVLSALGTPLKMATGKAYAVAFSPDDSTLVTALGTPASITVWDVRDAAHPQRIGVPLKGPTLETYSMAFSPDGGTLAVGSADRTVQLLDMRDRAAPTWIGSPLLGPGDYVNSVAISADGRILSAASGDGIVRQWDISTPTAPALHASLGAAGDTALYALALSPDGRHLASSGTATTVHIWGLDPEAIVSAVCSSSGAGLTDVEWRQYVPGVSPADPCGHS